jgi:mannan endo-1,4-beta-mannosidase
MKLRWVNRRRALAGASGAAALIAALAALPATGVIPGGVWLWGGGLSRPCGPVEWPGQVRGVALAGQLRSGLAEFGHVTRTIPDLVEFYVAFGQPFNADAVCPVEAAGAVPLVQLDPHHQSVADIAAGKYDAYLTSYGQALRAFGSPIGFGFGHEMNGYWYPWGEAKGTDPATFRVAWRRIHRLFTRAGAGNVRYVWTVSRGTGVGMTPAQRWWPGSRYVDYVGIDGYYRSAGDSFAELFNQPLRLVRGFTHRPVIITEVAATDPAQISDLFAGLTADSVAGFVWFNINAKGPWHLNGNTPNAAAYQVGVTAFAKAAR